MRREKDPGDARATHVTLTRDGLHAIAAASDTHLSGVRRHMIDQLTPRQLASLAKIGETVVQHLERETEVSTRRAGDGDA